MKKKMLWRDTFREIKNSRNRFISILLIVFLGAGFFVGVKCTAPSIRASAESYFNKGELFDIRVLSTVGFSDDDAKEILGVEGVTGVMPSYTVDVTLKNDAFAAVKISSLPTDAEGFDMMNIPTVKEGRLPERSGECVIAYNRLLGNSYNVGDKISIAETVGDTDVTEYLNTLEYEVVGIFYSPLYFSFTFESTTVGNGSISDVLYVISDDFAYPRYTEMFVSIDRGGDDVTTFDAEYDEAVLAVTEKLEDLGADRIVLFRDEYTKEADEAEKTLAEEKAEAEKQLADAKAELESAKLELETAEADLIVAWADFEAQKTEAMGEFADVEKQLIEAKKSIEENRQKIADAEVKYADAKKKFDTEFGKAEKDLNDAKKEINSAKKEYEDGYSKYETELKKFNTEKKKYDDALAEYNKGKADYDKGKADYDKGLKEYNDGLAKYKKGLEDYEKGLEDYNAAYLQLKPHLDEYDDGVVEYENGMAEYEAGLEEYNTNKQLFDEKEAEYQAAYQEYRDSLATYNQTISQLPILRTILTEQQYEELLYQLEIAKRELAAAKTQLDAAEKEINAARLELNIAKNELDEGKAELDAAKLQLEEAWAELKGPKTELEAAEADLKAADKELKSNEKKLADAEKTLADSKKKLEDAKKELDAGKEEIDKATPDVEAGQKELDAAKAKLDDAKAQLDEAERDYNEGLAKYNREYKKAEDDIEEAERDISDGKKQIEEAEQLLDEREEEVTAKRAEVDLQFADAEAELKNAETELLNGKTDYENGVKDYDTEYANFEKTVADAEADIKMLRDLLLEAEGGVWYPMDRYDAVTQYQSLSDDCGRLDAIVNIFPVFFLAVACLVCLTTMTRMVDEQRTQMGTYKALGYSSSDIKKKFLIYALTATTVGGIIGIAVCVQILPRVISSAYSVMYQFDEFNIVMMWDMALISMLVSVLCIVIITEICSRRELRITTAALMRPKAPKAGKKILLERIGFLWNHIGFGMKVTLRNLFRYKLRLAMTVIGISGCMMLMVAAFGLQNSILAIVDKQYVEIFAYELDIVPNDALDEDGARALNEQIRGYDFIDKSMASLQTAITVSYGDSGELGETTLFVPDRTAEFDKFIFMYPVGTDIEKSKAESSPIKLSSDGAVMTEKLAKVLGIKAGDTVNVTYEGKKYGVVIADICKNYVLNNLYMSAEYYDSVFGADEPLFYNRVEGLLSEGADEDHAISTLMSEVDSVLYAGSLSSADDLLSDMVEGLNMVVIVMILCAGALAFLVVYNLTNINISERVREIATIKVLGFKPFESNMYVFRENIFMCIAGILFGSVAGYYLAQFMIETVEVNATMFERILPASGFIYSALLTLAFTLIVSLVMTRRVKSISMVESLKAIE